MLRPQMTASGSLSIMLAAAAGLAAAASTAAAQDIEVIYTKISTHPTSLVPGALDLAGQPVETRIRALEDLVVSPDGSQWVLKSRNQLGGDLETMLLKGSGTSGSMFMQEGQPVVGGAPGELIDFFGSGLGRFDDTNRFALSLRARGGVSSVFQKIVLWDGTNFTVPYAMGSPLFELLDVVGNVTGDETFGNSVGSIHLLNGGRIGSQDSSIGSIHTSRRPALFYDDTSFHQTGVTTVLGLDGVTPETWATLDANSFYTTPDGEHWFAQGRVVGQASTEAAVAYDGQLLLRTGSPIAPGATVLADIFQNHLASSGDLYSRGSIVGGGVWAARNGQLVAKTGDPITPGSEFAWGTTFLAFSGNADGDWVLVGTTNNPDTARDTVVVVNGEQVVMTEGDPIDLDGNGAFDDDVFIGRGTNTLAAFEANDAALTGDMTLFILANIRNAAGQDLNSNPSFGTPQAFFRVVLGGGECRPDWNEDGTVNSSDISSFLTAWLASVTAPDLVADFNEDGMTNSSDISAFLTAWLDAVVNGC